MEGQFIHFTHHASLLFFRKANWMTTCIRRWWATGMILWRFFLNKVSAWKNFSQSICLKDFIPINWKIWWVNYYLLLKFRAQKWQFSTKFGNIIDRIGFVLRFLFNSAPILFKWVTKLGISWLSSGLKSHPPRCWKSYQISSWWFLSSTLSK